MSRLAIDSVRVEREEERGEGGVEGLVTSPCSSALFSLVNSTLGLYRNRKGLKSILLMLFPCMSCTRCTSLCKMLTVKLALGSKCSTSGPRMYSMAAWNVTST